MICSRVNPELLVCKRAIVSLLLACVCLWVVGCATPTARILDFARVNDLKLVEIDARGFNLVSFDNRPQRGSEVPGRNVLHVYLEGDGQSWRSRNQISRDPTPRSPLMLELMALDRQPSIYVGRPCYNDRAWTAICNKDLWTFGRFSETVVSAMADAIARLARRHRASELWLFGHSGGGGLAMLLAERLPTTSRVVTLAGNLDTEAWTRHHDYTPLYSSYNPAERPTLPADIWQWHMVGARDSVIPPHLVMPFVNRQASASGFRFSQYGHNCCWKTVWPQILKALDQNDPSMVPAEQFKRRAPR